MNVQVTFASQGRSGIEVLTTYEVDDVASAHQLMTAAGYSVEYGAADEP